MTVKTSDDAISPVIGVMLMLVVTIVIAAVVAAVATGMMTETEPAPTAKLDVKIYSEHTAYAMGGFPVYAPTMHITHVSGDTLDTKDLKLTFSWVCDKGDTHFSSYEYNTTGIWGLYDSRYNDGEYRPFGDEKETFVHNPADYSGSYIQPLYVNYGNDGGAFFGSTMLKRGMTLMAFDIHLFPDVQHEGNPAMDALFNNGEVITHLPVIEDPNVPTCPHNSEIALVYHAEPWEYDAWGMTISVDAGWYCSNCWEVHYEYSNIEPSEGSASGAGLVPGIMECLTPGTAVEVTVIHKPSNKPVYNEEVYVL